MIAIYGSLHQLFDFVRHIFMLLIFPYCVDSGVLCVMCSFVIVSLTCIFLFDHTYIQGTTQMMMHMHVHAVFSCFVLYVGFIRFVLLLFSLWCVICFVCCFACWFCVVCV